MSLINKIAPHLDWSALVDRAQDLVREQIAVDGDGVDKMQHVTRQLAKWLDDQLDWHSFGVPSPFAEILESVDGPILRALLRGVVESALVAVRAQVTEEIDLGADVPDDYPG